MVKYDLKKYVANLHKEQTIIKQYISELTL